ncbi:GIY-YIG nuclease family protein [Corynebacterium uropygiale]|uniref:GIY-YIG nuclease family protein n=1 Tax=Corynebacterium uropygiale TaxID=1775911 RepID=A0A9X1QLS2_9CORY|nr:GIY-YIG nuclease family protein [Corynebacterium uropygiale]MCF4005592.1 GIY-YIG nuclease family protein [Corynebacterium uropygiale]
MANTPDFSPELLALLNDDTDGLFDEPVRPRRMTSEDRLERAFTEILEFYDTHRRAPSPDTMDIAERKLGARLVGILNNEDKKAALAHLDDVGLLTPDHTPDNVDELLDTLDDDDILSDILDDNDEDDASLYDTATLPRRSPKPPAGGVATRKKAPDFDTFAPLFQQKQQELRDGTATLVTFTGENTIAEGKFYELRGMLAFVAEIKEPEEGAPLNTSGRPKVRLRVIFDNGTESSMYLKSFAIQLYVNNGKVVARAGQITADEIGDADVETGHLYVLSSLSTNPEISQLSDLHKIGYCTTSVEQRLRDAEREATYLHAPVRIDADYHLYNMRPSALEHLLHRVFAPARLDISSTAAAGNSHDVTEWFIAPLSVIDQAVAMIANGDIVDYVYNPALMKLEYVGGEG